MASWLVLLWVTIASAVSDQPPCDRAPPHAQPADTLYRMGVAGDPDLFLPGELYTVSLQGIDTGEGPTPFTGFIIWAESAILSVESATSSEAPIYKETLATNFSLGGFQAYDTQSRLHEYCQPAVINATSHTKTEIQVIWSAPNSAMDVCIRLCAKVGPSAGGAFSVLARKLCVAPTAPATLERQPPIVEPCCACDEAKYEVTFEGLWSRYIHPRDFPPESARAHFGDVIGASHTAQYRVWQEGRVASSGLRRLADDGATTALEKELKAESDHIRTIIKARGISWQQVGGVVGSATTFAVFRVDARHHLMSLSAKLAPSPDWFVGVSAFELCNANCTWRRMATLPLYPYDAGTDNGLTYTSRRETTIPPAAVRALRPDWPRDVRSPFFNNNGEMRPFARLRLNRLRLYEKSCDSTETGTDQGREVSANTAAGGGSGGAEGAGAGSGVGACATMQWGAWSACSVSCGGGHASRQRQYVWPQRAFAEACRVQLTDYQRCHGPRMHCRAVSEYEPDPAESSGPCAVSQWSTWSPCEGCGVRARTRHYLAPRAYKRCHIGFRASTVMHQSLPCEAGPCHRPTDPKFANSTNFDWFFVDQPRGECRMSSWGEWSPCSARCGRGRRLRTRIHMHGDARVRDVLLRLMLQQWNQVFASWQGIELPTQNITADDPEVEEQVNKHMNVCQSTLTQQESLCDADTANCPEPTSSEVCALPMAVGPCRGYEERWFYDAARRVCEPFGFTGCGGNGNNFRTQIRCNKVCSNYTIINNEATIEQAVTTKTTTVIESTTKKNKLTKLYHNNEVMQNDAATANVEDADCEVTGWLGWSHCFGDCNNGIKLNYRHVVHASSGSGHACPTSLVKSRFCTPQHCRHNILSTIIPLATLNKTDNHDDII